MLEDCKIPIFARGKLYADFRKSFDQGLCTVLESVAKITNPNLARFKEPEYHTDYATEWGTAGRVPIITLTYIDHAKGQPYSCLTQVHILCKLKDSSQAAIDEFLEEYSGALIRFKAIEALHTHLESKGTLRPRLSDQHKIVAKFKYTDRDSNKYETTIGVRRLGDDTGRDVLLNVSNLIDQTYRHQKEVLRIKSHA